MTESGDLHDHRGLIILAGEKLWHDVDALAQWGDHLDEVRVLRGEGQHTRGGPSDRLTKFIRSAFPHLTVVASEPVDTHDPAAVRRVVDGLTEAPGTKWILNASGGTRLMFAGARDSAALHDNVTLVYREQNAPWCEILPTGETNPIGGINQSAADRFSVRDLLQVTWSDPQRDAHCAPNAIPDFLHKAAYECLEQGKPWQECFGDAYSDSQTMPEFENVPSGILFEQFVGALILGLGVAEDDLTIGVTLRHDGRSMQEVDIVVNSNGALNVIDCKLTDEDSERSAITSQIRLAETTKRYLGDGSGQMVLLRPNRLFTHEELSLCDAYDLVAIDRQAAGDLPRLLATLLNTPEHPIEPVPATAAVRGSHRRTVGDDVPIFDFDGEFAKTGEKWLAFILRSKVHVALRLPDRMSAKSLERRILDQVGGLATIHELNTSVTGKSATVVFVPTDRKAFVEFLRGMHGKSF